MPLAGCGCLGNESHSFKGRRWAPTRPHEAGKGSGVGDTEEERVSRRKDRKTSHHFLLPTKSVLRSEKSTKPLVSVSTKFASRERGARLEGRRDNKKGFVWSGIMVSIEDVEMCPPPATCSTTKFLCSTLTENG